MKLCLVISICLCLSWEVKSAKVLFVAPFPAHSHFTLMFRLAEEMAGRGHEVTVINPYPRKKPIKNYKDISAENTIEFVEEIKKTLFDVDNLSTLQSMTALLDMALGVTQLTFKNEHVLELLNSKQTFDLVVVEHFFNEAFIGFGYLVKAPVIVLSAMSANHMNNFLVANPGPSSYVPNLGGTLTPHMNFWQRLQNFLINNIVSVLRDVWYMPYQRDLFRKHISSDVELDDFLNNNISLMLTNSHISISDPIPKVPAIIEIGGYHVSPPKPLPKDLQTFLDDAKEGVVLFSMGSNLRSKDLKPETKIAILKSFSKIKQKVLWKFETDLPEAPPNVRIMSWIPQQDILAHPNIRAFITHGGLLSTIETVYYGVPVVGIPVYGDQKGNIARAVINGYALSIPLDEVTEANLSKALDEILNNPKYRENVKQRSKLMQDQPLKPIDTAVYWMEHVIRHKGAPHLRSAALNLTWYQRELVDVIGFIIFVSVSISSLLYIAIKIVVSILLRKKKITKITPKKKKNN